MHDGQNQPPATQQDTSSTWQFQPSEESHLQSPVQASTQIDWTASEFIAHHKNLSWYLSLTGIFALFAGAVFFFTRDIISTVVIGTVGISFAFFAARKPRELHFALNNSGISIGDKFYPYSQFKSFSLIQEDASLSVWLMPLKRFMPIITMYFDPNDQDKITNTLSNFLPFENREPDFVDKFLHRIRF